MADTLDSKTKKYFLLADQYLETTKLLMNTMIENENRSVGIGRSEEEALENLKKNIIKSDAYLCIPCMFTAFQTVELFIKGLLLFNDEEITYSHEVVSIRDKLREIYGKDSGIYKSVSDFYKYQMEVLKKFKKNNNITTTTDLYESLRYPESTNKEYEYFDLKYNGKEVINQYKKMLIRLDEIKTNILKEIRKEN